MREPDSSPAERARQALSEPRRLPSDETPSSTYWRSVVRFLVTALSLGSVLFVGATPAFLIAAVFMFGFDLDLRGWPERATMLVLLLPAAFYGSLPVVCFLGRVFPVHALGKKNGCLTAALLYVLVAGLVGIVNLALRPGLQGGALAPFVFLSVAVGLALFRHWTARLDPDTPTVVFLRQFSGTSDQGLLRTLQRALPSGSRVSYLVPAEPEAGDLEPYVTAFAGLRFKRPLRRTPLPVRAPAANWFQFARLILRRSSVAVVDLSHPSGSLLKEARFLCELGRAGCTLWTAEERNDEWKQFVREAGLEDDIPFERVVRYSARRRYGIPRSLVVGLLFGVSALVLHLAAVPTLERMFALFEEVPDAGAFPPLLLSSLAIAILVGPAWKVILQPEISPASKQKLRTALADVMASREEADERAEADPWAEHDAAMERLLENEGPHALVLRRADGGEDAAVEGVFAVLAKLGFEPLSVSVAELSEDQNPGLVQLLERSELLVADASGPACMHVAGFADALRVPTVCFSTSPVSATASSRRIVRAPGPGDSLSRGAFAEAIRDTLRQPVARGPLIAHLDPAPVIGESHLVRRLVAFAVDLLLGSIVYLAYALLRGIPLQSAADAPPPWLLPTLLLAVLHTGITTRLRSTTVGMRLFGLRIRTTNGKRCGFWQAAGRACFFIMPSIWGVTGGWLALKGPAHQTLHDALSRTMVVRKSAPLIHE